MSDGVTDYGFLWGPLEVTRVCQWRKNRILDLRTPRAVVQIVVTPTGLVRIHSEKKRKP